MTRMWKHKFWFLPAVSLLLAVSADFVMATQQQYRLNAVVKNHLVATLRQDADKPIDQTLRAHWISVNEDGNIEGRVSALDPDSADAAPIKKLTVTLLRQGERVRKSKTDKEGRFMLEDVPSGTYTLVASGRTGFLAYGVHVLPHAVEMDLDNLNADTRSKSKMQLPTTVAQRRAFYVSHFNLPQDAVVAEELQIDAAAVPPQFSTLRRISQNYMSASSAFSILADRGDLKAIAKANQIDGGFQFPLSPNGDFHGRIQPIATEDGRKTRLSEMNLFLVQEDVEITKVAAEENGDFKMEDVEPGVYSLIAAGKDGFAALSLELVASAEADAAKDGVGGDEGLADPVGAFVRPSNMRLVSSASMPNAVVGKAKAQQAKIPALGIAIVTDPRDIAQIAKEVNRIAALNEVALDPNGPPLEGFNGGNVGGGFAAPGGFAPGGFAPGGFAPGGFAPGGFGGGSIGSGIPAGGALPLASGFSGAAGAASLFGGGAGGVGRLLGIAGIAGGIAAVADDGNDNPAPVSTSTTTN